jgi:hypothetical protein
MPVKRNAGAVGVLKGCVRLAREETTALQRRPGFANELADYPWISSVKRFCVLYPMQRCCEKVSFAFELSFFLSARTDTSYPYMRKSRRRHR